MILNSPLHSIGQMKEIKTNNFEIFNKDDIGGVAIALTHGSILFEVRSVIKYPHKYCKCIEFCIYIQILQK